MSQLPPAPRLYRALCERDTSFEGVFVFGVRTTGVFCRPGCGARTPRAENCRFFAGAEEALRAGFRACLRCRPLERAGAPDALVERLLAWVEERAAASAGGEAERGAGERVRDAELVALGIEPSTARRRFRARCGMTFQAYQRARRMGLALERLRERGELAEALELAGYESFSGFHAAFRAHFGAASSRAGELRTLTARQLETPLGPMLALADEQALVLLEFHDRRALAGELARLRARASIVPGDNALLAGLARELEQYFAGARTRFTTPLALEGTPFQREVWRALGAIPCGQTRSYAQLAAALGKPGAVRAVGRANGRNRLAIVVPCHRVIGADGALVGYGGQLWRKQRLLELERAAAAPESRPQGRGKAIAAGARGASR